METWVAMEVQPKGVCGKPKPPRAHERAGRWKLPIHQGIWFVDAPYKPGDAMKVREVWASPSKYIVAYDSDGECGAFVEDGGGGRFWIHHGYVLESTGYKRFTQEDVNVRTWGLRKYGGDWQPAATMPAWAMRSFTVESVEPELRDGVWGWKYQLQGRA